MFVSALLVQYNGTSFHGFQRQNRVPSVQSHLEKSIGIALREEVRVAAAGRTDTGVHARGMVVSFSSQNKIENYHKFLTSLNALTPPEISVLGGALMPEKFHARFSCTEREYEYWILNSKFPYPLLEKRALWVHQDINFSRMDAELQKILGKFDFRSFAKTSSVKDRSTERRLSEISISRSSDFENIFKIRIRGTGFLHNMIRILVGSAMQIAMGKKDTSLVGILEKANRNIAGITLPPHGLYFYRAYYKDYPEIDFLYSVKPKLSLEPTVNA